MSLLTIVNNVAAQLAIPQVVTAISSADPQATLMVALANTEGRELSSRYRWQALQNEATFTTVAAEDQGAISTIAPGFRFFLNGTQWNRSQQRPIPNITPNQWQLEKSSSVTGPYQEYRVRGGRLLYLPAPPAGETAAFEYVSKNWITTSVGGTSDVWTNDNDTSLLEEFIIEQGLRWRFLRQKGMDYSEEFLTYERLVADAMSRDGGKPVLDAGGSRWGMGLRVPDGSWPVP